MVTDTPDPTPDFFRWCAFLKYPVGAMSYELCEDPEIAMEVLQMAHFVYRALNTLTRDGWTIEFHWTEDGDAFYSAEHGDIATGDEASERLKQLGLLSKHCAVFDPIKMFEKYS